MVFLCLFLWLEPIKTPKRTQNTLNITLQPPQTQPKVPPKTTVRPQPETNIEPKEKASAKPKSQIKQPEKITKSVPKPELIEPQIKTPEKQTTTISTGQILNQARSYTDIQITDEFKAAQPNTFKAQTYQVHDPYADIPYLPTHELAMDMDFYAEGLEGNLERFTDKITLEKTITTKYGTKITCALVVIFFGCGWK